MNVAPNQNAPNQKQSKRLQSSPSRCWPTGCWPRRLPSALLVGVLAVALAAESTAHDPATEMQVRRPGRPTHIAVDAALGNWDRDAQPDGWQARIVLLDKKSQPSPKRAHASFELIPRVPSLDRTRYVDLPVQPMKWWKPLEFDESGIAVVRLPKRSDAPVPTFAHQGRETRFGRRPYLDNRFGRGVFGDRGEVAGSPRPVWAVLRVRVSVPGVGVLESVAPVPFAEPLLVDSGWPYR